MAKGKQATVIPVHWRNQRRRVVGSYEWTPENGYVCEVDAETAAELLTAPGGGFETVELTSAQTKALDEALGVDTADAVDAPEPETVDEEKQNG